MQVIASSRVHVRAIEVKIQDPDHTVVFDQKDADGKSSAEMHSPTGNAWCGPRLSAKGKAVRQGCDAEHACGKPKFWAGFRQRDSHVCVRRADDCHAFGDNTYVCVQITRVTNRSHASSASRDHLSESSLIRGNGPANHTHLARPRCEGYHQIKDAMVRVLDIVSVREGTRSRAGMRAKGERAGGREVERRREEKDGGGRNRQKKRQSTLARYCSWCRHAPEQASES